MDIFTAAKPGDLTLITFYLKIGKNVNAIDFNGMTPLIFAVRQKKY